MQAGTHLVEMSREMFQTSQIGPRIVRMSEYDEVRGVQGVLSVGVRRVLERVTEC